MRLYVYRMHTMVGTILIGYIIVVFILSRIFIPHMGFANEPVPEKLPAGMLDKINELKNSAKDGGDFLQRAYDYLGTRYHSGRLNTFTRFFYLFRTLDQIWQMEGYIPCTQNNYLMRIFLVKSGFYKNDDIRTRHVFCNMIIHQYLQVKLNGKWIAVDVGERIRHYPIGKHLRFFG